MVVDGGNLALGAHSACSDGTLSGIRLPVVAGISVYTVGFLARYSAASSVAPVARILVAGSLGRYSFLPAPSGNCLAFHGTHPAAGCSFGALDGLDSRSEVSYQTVGRLVDRGWARAVVSCLGRLPGPGPEVRSIGPASCTRN